MNRCFRKVAVFLISFSLVCFSTACANSNEAPKAHKSEKPDDLKIGLSFDSYVIERWTRERDIFCATANDLGAEVNVQSANGEVETQIAQLQYFINLKVDCIVVVAIDADALTDTIIDAKDAGIPVICYDRIIRNANADLYISFDNEGVGVRMAEAICGEIGDNSNIVEIMGPESDYNVPQVMSGFDSICEKHGQNVLLKYNCDGWRQELAYNFVNDNIEVISQAEAIMCGNDALAGETVHALAENGLAGKIKVVGQDADIEACQRIVEGTQLMTVYKPVESLAKLAAEYAVKLARHESLGTTMIFNDGTYNIPYVAIEPIAVNKDNLDNEIIESGFHLREEVYINVNMDPGKNKESSVSEEESSSEKIA